MKAIACEPSPGGADSVVGRRTQSRGDRPWLFTPAPLGQGRTARCTASRGDRPWLFTPAPLGQGRSARDAQSPGANAPGYSLPPRWGRVRDPGRAQSHFQVQGSIARMRVVPRWGDPEFTADAAQGRLPLAINSCPSGQLDGLPAPKGHELVARGGNCRPWNPVREKTNLWSPEWGGPALIASDQSHRYRSSKARSCRRRKAKNSS